METVLKPLAPTCHRTRNSYDWKGPAQSSRPCPFSGLQVDSPKIQPIRISSECAGADEVHAARTYFT